MLAYVPYVIIIVLFSVQQIPPITKALNATTLKFRWPGLDVRTPSGAQASSTTFTFNWLAAAGTILLIAGVLTMLVLRVRPGDALRAYGETLSELRSAIVTVMAVLALAYVMNLSGPDDHHRAVARGDRRVLRGALPGARVAGDRGHGVGHVVELAVRSAADGRRRDAPASIRSCSPRRTPPAACSAR